MVIQAGFDFKVDLNNVSHTWLKVINDKGHLHNYCPVSKYRFSKAVGDNISDINSEYSRIVSSYKKNYKVIENMAVLMPCYQDEWRITKDDSNKQEIQETHTKFFTDYVTLTRSKDEFHPHIVSPNLKEKDLSTYILQWNEIQKLPISKAEKIKKVKMLPYMTFTYRGMSAKVMRFLCDEYKAWLLANTHIKYVLLPDVAMAQHIFPSTKTGRSFNACCFERYVNYDYGRKITFMFTLSPSQIADYEEAGFTMQSEIINTLVMDPEPLKCKVNIIKDELSLRSILDKLKAVTLPSGKRKYKTLAVDTETTGLNPAWFDQHILAGGFSNGEEAWVFLVDHPYYKQHKNIKLLSVLYEYSSSFDFIFQNGKFDIRWIKQFIDAIPSGMIYDTMLIDHWLYEGYGSLSSDLKLNPGLYSMALQTSRYLGLTTHKTMLDKYFDKIEVENPTKAPRKGDDLKNMTIKELREEIAIRNSDVREPNSWAYAKLPLHTLLKYLGYDCYATHKIFEKQIGLIRQETGKNIPRVIAELLPKEIKLIAEMEHKGANLNYEKLIEQVKVANNVISENEAAVRDKIGGELNIDSGDQLASYLMRTCGIPLSEFQTDAIDPEKVCTDTDTLNKFTDKLPWLKNLIAYKKAMKARNTYLIPFVYHSYKGRLYYNLKLTGTATGRLASDRPNMQNIPATLGEGANRIEVKQVISATEGKMLMDADLKTAEVKVLTAVCPDPRLIEAIKNNMDLHCYTASFAYHTPYEALYEAYAIKEGIEGFEHIAAKPEHKTFLKYRKAAKSTTFLVLYGGGPAGLARQLPSTYEYNTGLDKHHNDTLKSKHDVKEAAKLIDMLKSSIYTILGETFKQSDSDILTLGYGKSLFGRRRRYDFTLPREIYKILETAGLTKELSIDDIKAMSPNQRPFRQNVNFQIQSSTSDYMQYFSSYIREHMPTNIGTEFWFTVHDSLVGEFIDTPENRAEVIRVFDEAMYKYLPSLHEKLLVDIGYSIGFTKEYCEIQK